MYLLRRLREQVFAAVWLVSLQFLSCNADDEAVPCGRAEGADRCRCQPCQLSQAHLCSERGCCKVAILVRSKWELEAGSRGCAEMRAACRARSVFFCVRRWRAYAECLSALFKLRLSPTMKPLRPPELPFPLEKDEAHRTMYAAPSPPRRSFCSLAHRELFFSLSLLPRVPRRREETRPSGSACRHPL